MGSKKEVIKVFDNLTAGAGSELLAAADDTAACAKCGRPVGKPFLARKRDGAVELFADHQWVDRDRGALRFARRTVVGDEPAFCHGESDRGGERWDVRRHVWPDRGRR